MRPFIHHKAPPGRRGTWDRRIAVPEIAGNFDDLARTEDWLPYGAPSPETHRSVTGDEPRSGDVGWLVTRTVSQHAF